LVEDNETIFYAGYEIKMLPYFDYGCDEFVKNFKEACTPQKPELRQVLMGHMAVYGSKNNDGTVISSGMTLKELSGFYMVLLGHYHNKQKIGKNVHHIPSIIQHNFGENNEKGFTILYEDGTMELVKSTFPEYKKVDINLNETSHNELKELVENYKDTVDNVKFVITGSKSEIQALDTSEMQSVGIRVQKKNYKDDIPNKLVKVTSEVFIWSKSTVKERFVKFVDGNNYNKDEGELLINKILKL
jgi:DNA repair exonuclease SbcCD nuclease subunit